MLSASDTPASSKLTSNWIGIIIINYKYDISQD